MYVIALKRVTRRIQSRVVEIINLIIDVKYSTMKYQNILRNGFYEDVEPQAVDLSSSTLYPYSQSRGQLGHNDERLKRGNLK